MLHVVLAAPLAFANMRLADALVYRVYYENAMGHSRSLETEPLDRSYTTYY